MDTRFNSSLHSCWDIGMIRINASFLKTEFEEGCPNYFAKRSSLASEDNAV
jgi:hypothetical protein